MFLRHSAKRQENSEAMKKLKAEVISRVFEDF
jgi:hypothetical protein